MRLWLAWLCCYTLFLWALRRRMWSGPARYLRSPLSRSLYANVMGSHGQPAPGARESHQVRPLRQPPSLPLPFPPPSPRPGQPRFPRFEGVLRGPRAGQRPPGPDKERRRPGPPGQKVGVGLKRRGGGGRQAGLPLGAGHSGAGRPARCPESGTASGWGQAAPGG